jgi:uncharacterized RmlC-like cupin family protein
MSAEAILQQQPFGPAITTVRPRAVSLSVRGVPNFQGISWRTAGSEHLGLHIVTIPPGGRAGPQRHETCETAIYILQGRIETLHGEGLFRSTLHKAGDFVFLPPTLLHMQQNLSSTDEAQILICRSDPNEWNIVVDTSGAGYFEDFTYGVEHG